MVCGVRPNGRARARQHPRHIAFPRMNVLLELIAPPQHCLRLVSGRGRHVPGFRKKAGLHGEVTRRRHSFVLSRLEKPVMIWSSSEPRTPCACACISRRPTEAEPASGEPVVLSVPAVPRIVRRQNGGRTRTTEGETTRERGRALPNPFISAPKDGLLDVHRGGRRTLKPDVRRKQRSPWGIGMPG